MRASGYLKGKSPLVTDDDQVRTCVETAEGLLIDAPVDNGTSLWPLPLTAISTDGQLDIDGGLNTMIDGWEHEVSAGQIGVGTVATGVDVVIDRILWIAQQTRLCSTQVGETSAFGPPNQAPAVLMPSQISDVALSLVVVYAEIVGSRAVSPTSRIGSVRFRQVRPSGETEAWRA